MMTELEKYYNKRRTIMGTLLKTSWKPTWTSRIYHFYEIYT